MLVAVSVVCTTMVAQKSITERTYWIDGDVGSAQTVTSSIDISSLPAGVHSLTLRVKDSENLWSTPLTKYFIIPQTSTAATSIVEREYWIDGNIAARAALGGSPVAISLVELAAGIHSLTVRVKDDTGLWSTPQTKYFIIPQTAIAATSIVEREYWIDGNTVTRAGLGGSPAAISLVELAAGMHSLTVRVKDNIGVWSTPLTKYFIVPSATGQEDMKIARYVYWFDDDTANPVTATVTNASGVLDIDIGKLTKGEHTLSWIMADSKGAWSDVKTETFTFTPVIFGDANQDGLVNVTDIVATVNYIMENPTGTFDKVAADVNKDGFINVSDIVAMVNIIMSSGSRMDQQEVMAILKQYGFIFKGKEIQY